ncbi:hypothetical protein EDC04DRAFT_1197943 [Pisolithus marmoratus]|nr:hypothetical protein EDC04DRAFT_1197943 [Pisolithus marmoratus]
MDYLPELAHDGHNWTAYGSSVLCAIIDDGLMGFLVGSETRPIHPAELDGRGEGWTPQTDNERNEVAVWRTADQSWTQRNAMVNYTIISGIPDTIFGCMLHLKSPLEKWDYLVKRFGSIPRPESWVAAEEAMRQSDSQPEQSTAGETTQSTRDSHDEPSNPPSEEADSPDGPNDCAETKSRYLTPETEVVDAQQIELYLPVVEVGTVNSKQPDERDHTGVASTSIPANIVAAKQPTVVLHKRTEIAYGPMAPEATIVDVQSQVAGSCAANSNEREGDRTEIPTGYLEPETEIVDVRQTEGFSLVDEAGATGATWPDESMNASKVPDDEVMASQDLPGLSSKALEPEGNNLLDTTSERAETKTGHTKPEPDVVDARQVVDILSMFEDGIADQERLDEHSNTLEAPDERSQRAADEVAERQDSPEWSAEAPEPAGDTAKQTSKRSIEFAQKTYLGQDQSLPMSGETVLDVPGPPLDARNECPTPQDELPVRMHSGTITELKLLCTRRYNEPLARRHDELQETRSLELDSKRASRRSQQIHHGHSTQDTPPDEVWGMGVHKHARTGRRDSADIRSTTTKLEIRATSAQMVDTWAHVGRRPKEPDKGDDGRYNDTVSRDIVNLRSIEKALLIDRVCQDSERETKQPDDLPAPHGLPPNGLMHTPKTSRIPHRHSRVNANPANVSGLKTRGYRRLVLNIPTSLPCKAS